MNFSIKYKQVGTQDDSYGSVRLADVAASCPTNSSPNTPVVFEQRKRLTPMTFSQKLYQLYALKIVEEFKQTIDANSIEEIKKALDKVLEARSSRV